MRSLCRSSILVLVGFLHIEISYSQQKVGLDEARTLVYESLSSTYPRHIIDVATVENQYDRDFLYFEATWPNPGGSPHLGNFAVNPWTGDVFNADNCKLRTTSTIRKLQQDIKKRLSLKQRDYAKFRARRPICAAE
jgi:hypothetical protein